MPKRINDGLTKYQRYRLKDLEGYRKRKREYARTPEERKKRTEYMRVWRENNREKHNAFSRDRYKRIGNTLEYKTKVRERWLKVAYNISQQDYLDLLNKQNGVCFICNQKPNKKSLHVDHSHKSGKVRGLLCSKCNGALGWLEKNSTKIKEYLNQDQSMIKY